jgi:hypothetical protein
VLAFQKAENDNGAMSLNLDKQSEQVTSGAEPTPDELAEAEGASYIIRAIGNPAIRGYTNSLEKAYGRALWIAHRTMVADGAQIDVSAIPSMRIELRISKDREAVVVQWVKTELGITKPAAEPNSSPIA